MANITVSSEIHEFLQTSTDADARTALGLGDSATKNVGTAASQVAAGDHDHSGVYQPLDSQLTDLAGLSYASNSLKVVRVNAGETAFELATEDGGLTNFTETLHTASPNNTVNAAQLEVTGGTTNADLVLTPKGNGAFILGPEPDGTTVGGNKRGDGAVDLQTARTVATQVASGTRAIAAGRNNTASGLEGVALGGNCVASGNQAVAFGSYARASGGSAIAIGRGDSNGAAAAGAFSFAVNGAVTASNAAGLSSVALVGGSSSATYSCAIGYGSVAARYGEYARSNVRFSAYGDCQKVLLVLANKTTDATPTVLFLNGTTASSRLTISSGKMLHAIVTVIGSKSDGTAVASYLRQVTIKNVAGTTSLVGSVITLGTDEAAGTSIAITADDTNDALKIEVTGIAAETWRWAATVDGVEIAYGT